MNPKTLALAPLMLVALSCGDAAIDGTYRGEALVEVSGFVRLDVSDVTAAAEMMGHGTLRVALLWAAPTGDATRFELISSVEQQVDASGSFPARYRLQVFEPPAASVLRAAEGEGGAGHYALAAVVAYVDLDADGRWQPEVGEQLVGAVPDTVLAWSPAGAHAPLFQQTLPSGYTLLRSQLDLEACAEAGHALLGAADSAAAELRVSLAVPFDAVVDLDCDGDAYEWVALCPPFDAVWELCRGGLLGGQDPALCDVCEAFLAPRGASGEVCDAWLGACFEVAPHPDCAVEWWRCRGQDPASLPACIDPVCLCHEASRLCHEEAGEDAESTCMARFDACLSP